MQHNVCAWDKSNCAIDDKGNVYCISNSGSVEKCKNKCCIMCLDWLENDECSKRFVAWLELKSLSLFQRQCYILKVRKEIRKMLGYKKY